MIRISDARRDEDGAAAVEFAIVLPVLLLIVFGIIDFGRAFWVKNNLVAAMREGGRVASAGFLNQNDPSGVAAQKVADYINATIGGPTPVTASQVSVQKNAAGYITVKMADGYAYKPMTPFANRFGLANLVFRDSATFRWEQAD